MRPTDLCLLSQELGGEGVPSEFRIFPMGTFKAGWNDGSERSYLFDELAAAAVLEQAAKRGTDLFVDYEHASLGADEAQDPAEAGKAAAWFKLELRADGLWAVDVRWTPDAAEKVRNREYRYLSPAFRVDRESSRPVRLFNVALTNLPATYQAEPLIEASMREQPRDHRAVAASASFADVSRAVETAIAAAAGIDLSAASTATFWLCDVYDASAVYQLGGHLFQVPYRMEGPRAVLTGDAVEVRRAYEPITGGTHMKQVLNALGLPENATEAQAVEKLSALQQAQTEAQPASELATQVFALTGKSAAAEALGVLQAFKASADQVEKLSARVAELEGEKRKAELEQVIASAKTSGKLTPALEEWARSQPIESLRAFVEKAPKVVELSGAGAPREPRPDPKLEGRKYEELSNPERAQLARENPETFSALRAEYQKRTGAK